MGRDALLMHVNAAGVSMQIGWKRRAWHGVSLIIPISHRQRAATFEDAGPKTTRKTGTKR